TIQDVEETITKLQELNLLVEVNVALSNIFEILLHNSHHDDFEDKFEYHLRCRAMMHSLKDFINKDKELLNSDAYSDNITKQILEDTYFKESMKLQLESDYNGIYHTYDQMITQNVADKIQSNLK
ncbi:MAG: hypothetical protein WA945_01160, partial [Arcobacteraceae bacterium]